MNLVLIFLFIFLTIYGFIRKREYVLAIILVGQPILKLMIKPFSSQGESIFLIPYFVLGFFALSIVRLHNRKSFKIHTLTLKLILLICIFFLTIIFSLIYTPDKTYGLKKVMEFIASPILIIVMTLITIDGKNSFDKTMKAIGNISLIIGITTICLVFIKTGNLVARVGTTQSRDIQLFGINFAVSIWFGRRMGIGFLAMLYTTLIEKSKMNGIKTLILAFLLILSASRGPVFSMMFTIFVITILNMKKKSPYKKFYKRIFIAMIILLNLSAMFLTLNSGSILNRLFTFADTNVLSRFNMFSLSISLIKENLLGYGIGSYPYLSNSIHEYPHNIILEIWLELGIHGLILFFIIVFLCFKYCYRLIKEKNTDYGSRINFALSVLMFALFNAQFSGDIISNEYIWFGIILISTFLGTVACNNNLSIQGEKYNKIEKVNVK